MSELVSIVMPAYNSADFIAEALDSCLAQTYPHIEIIVVDDGSTDETTDIVRGYGERIRLIQQSNQGPAIARNTGIQASKGDYIQFCDSDDRLHPEKVARCIDLLLNHPEAALVYNKMQPIDAQGQALNLPTFPPDDFFETTELFCKILDHVGSPLQTSTLLARKNSLEAVGYYRADPHQRCAEDWDLLLRLADQYPMLGLNEVLTYYRKSPHTLSGDPLLMAEGRLQTTIYARNYPSRKNCLIDEAYDFFEAGRHHNLAMTLWQYGNRSQARHHLQQAIMRTHSGRIQRQITILATYFLTFGQFDTFLKRLKRKL